MARIVYHLVVGGFFIGATIFFCFMDVLSRKDTGSEAAHYLGYFVWLPLTVCYMILRISAECRKARQTAAARDSGVEVTNPATPAMPATPKQSYAAVWVGAFAYYLVLLWPISLALPLWLLWVFHGWHWGIGAAYALLALVATGWATNLYRGQNVVQQNNQAIAAWVASATDESEKARRVAYVASNALLIGAAAAGVEAYAGAPDLTWPTGFAAIPAAQFNIFNSEAGQYAYPDIPFPASGSGEAYSGGGYSGSYSDDDDDAFSASRTEYNPASGLPLVGGIGSPDVAGNDYGTNSM